MKEVFHQLPHINLCTVEHMPQSLTSESPQVDVVLALHGWLDNANSFLPMMECNKTLNVIAIEIAGHGYSQHRGPDSTYQLLDYVYDLYVLIKQNNWNRVHIVGHSLGAIIASIFAGTFPEMVNKLVLIEALGPISTQADETKDQLKKSIITRYKSALKVPSFKGYTSVKQAIKARLMVSDFSEDLAALLVNRSLEKIDDKFRWRSDPKLKQLSSIRMMEAQAIDLLSGITTSTLLILGDEGYQSLKLKLDERVKVISSINIISFAGGHHVHMQQPKLVWNAIERHILV